MSEYVFVHVGQAGIQIGQNLWQQLFLEHMAPGGTLGKINLDVGNPHSWFNEEQQDWFTPRAVFADVEPDVIDSLWHSNIGQFFESNSFICGNDGGTNNYNHARYISGKEIRDKLEVQVYSQIEKWDNFKGVIMTCSIGGSSGSALGDTISEFLGISNIQLYRFCVVPSLRYSNTVVEAYNAILCLHELISRQNPNILIDNESCYKILTNLGIENPTFNEINELITLQIWNLIAPSKYNWDSNSSLDAIFNNLIPLQSLNFLLPSYSPFLSEKDKFEVQTVSEITSQVFRSQNSMISCKRENGIDLSTYLNYFGDCSQIEVKYGIQSLIDSKLKQLPEWSWCFKTNITNRPKMQESEDRALGYLYNSNLRSCSMLANSTSIKDTLNSIWYKFDIMYAKRAFVHWYSGIGLSEGYFMEAREDVK